MSVINKILKKYNHIPLWVMNLIAPFYYMIPENKRYGKVYAKEKKELERIDRLSPEEVENEKNEALRNLINYAYNHVPYYMKLFDSISLKPEEIQCERDLYKIPFLTKELLTANRDELISDEFDKSQLIYLTTSGSTGTPTGFYVQKESPMREWVYCLHMLAPFGKKPDDSKLVMRGKSFKSEDRNRTWQWDAFKRELSINIFEMTNENMEEYCKAIEKHKPALAYGYPSAMYTLCKYISTRPTPLKHSFKGFEAISETLLPEQKRFIEETIHAKVFSFYGMSERVIIATNVPETDGYVIQPMYGIAELIDNDGNIVSKPGINGEIVGTGLLNYAMPLIRYKTGDMANWADDDAYYGKVQGTYRHLADISGRKQTDVLVTKDGRIVSMASLEVHSKIYDYMSRYQFFQNEIGKVEIKAVPINGLKITSEMKKEIEDTFKKRTNESISFTVQVVNQIKPKGNGKTSIIEQKLNIEEYLS